MCLYVSAFIDLLNSFDCEINTNFKTHRWTDRVGGKQDFLFKITLENSGGQIENLRTHKTLWIQVDRKSL